MVAAQVYVSISSVSGFLWPPTWLTFVAMHFLYGSSSNYGKMEHQSIFHFPFLKAQDAEHIFKYLLVICISRFEDCLCVYDRDPIY